ncbi:hypothetical protein T440DRAFT_403933 [Plenodomus tracheiphilus IPT5]|uniref:Uncharacterized protein n=1 Tax=Plenodomus tracheiphilus IPT5 TaxID=1408161 RepID=A0A6A7AYN5_9PLEO|nr:hypothetical protein T440DRAFT_403933 [Plenodomus tracheiphilus IPT5]
MDEDEEKDRKNTSVTISSIHCPTPTEDRPPPPYRQTWGNDSVPNPQKRRNWGSFFKPKSRWTWGVGEKCSAISKTTRKTTGGALNTGYACLRDTIWPAIKKFRFSRKQCFALLLLAFFAFAPMICLGYFTTGGAGNVPYYEVFSDKTMGCGQSLGSPQNATVTGVEKLFVLDSTFGRFSFSQVKVIDVAWDLFVGRGVQICAAWASYRAFSDALLLVIERHPASFRIFQRIALEGPSLHSLWTLIKELFTRNDAKTKILFSYMLVATLYVLTVPIFLGAMTGYDSTNIAWIDLDASNNIVPASMVKFSWLALGTKNQTFDQAVCVDESIIDKARQRDYARNGRCDCKLDNGTMISAKEYYHEFWGSCKFKQRHHLRKRLIKPGIYDFPGNTQTFTYTPSDYIYGNKTMDIELYGKKYDYSDIKSDSGYCYNNIAYNYTYLYDKTRCLPDTANPSYEWGFATMMTGIFVFLTFGWSTSLYIVWQHARFNSSLVKSGYTMTPLRAAFAMAKAAKKKTGMGERQLIRAYTKDLENELYGGCGVQATSVEYKLFVEDPEEGDEDRTYLSVREIRARHVRGLSEAESSRS